MASHRFELVASLEQLVDVLPQSVGGILAVLGVVPPTRLVLLDLDLDLNGDEPDPSITRFLLYIHVYSTLERCGCRTLSHRRVYRVGSGRR